VQQLTLRFKNRMVTSSYQSGVSVNELSEYLRNRPSGMNFWRKWDFFFVAMSRPALCRTEIVPKLYQESTTGM